MLEWCSVGPLAGELVLSSHDAEDYISAPARGLCVPFIGFNASDSHLRLPYSPPFRWQGGMELEHTRWDGPTPDRSTAALRPPDGGAPPFELYSRDADFGSLLIQVMTRFVLRTEEGFRTVVLPTSNASRMLVEPNTLFAVLEADWWGGEFQPTFGTLFLRLFMNRPWCRWDRGVRVGV